MTLIVTLAHALRAVLDNLLEREKKPVLGKRAVYFPERAVQTGRVWCYPLFDL